MILFTDASHTVFRKRRKEVIVRAWPRVKNIPARNDPRFNDWAFALLRLYKPFRTANDLCIPSINSVFSAHLAAGGFPLLAEDDNDAEPNDTEDEAGSDTEHILRLFDPPVLDQRFLQDDYQLLMDISRLPHNTVPLLGMRELDVIHQWPSVWHGWPFQRLVSWLVDTKENVDIQPVPFAPVLGTSLSVKQRAAFDIIQSHCFGSDQNDQLLMIVLGTAGTGKSYLIDAFRTLFAERGCSNYIKITAPMGIAAANITGSTIYSLLSISNPNLSGQRLLALQLQMQSVRLLVIDEYSFLSIAVIDTLDRHLRLIYPHSLRPFGGLNIVLCGDPAQLPPVLAQPLYAF